MERPSIWVIIVVLLLSVLFLREPRFQRSEETFLRWLIRHSQPAVKAVPITIVETGREHPPGEDVRILSTLGFINLPEESAADLHVPLLFQYRGDVIPSFALQAALLWMRLTPGEVKIDIESAITLPNGTKIPIRSDGTLLINSRTVQR